MRTVRVYYDEGAGEFSRACLSTALRTHLKPGIQVKRIYADEILASDSWHTDCLLLAMPGGADLPYAKKLNGKGNQSIKQFVKSGGRYLGICAGAYYGASKVTFNKGQANEVVGSRELNFFKGCAKGSIEALAAPYQSDLIQTSKIIDVTVNFPKPEHLPVFYWGGPEFIADTSNDNFETLSYYRIKDAKKKAIVKTNYYDGSVILCGVHPEVTGEQYRGFLDQFEDGVVETPDRFADPLIAFDEKRKRLFRLLLSKLDMYPFLGDG